MQCNMHRKQPVGQLDNINIIKLCSLSNYDIAFYIVNNEHDCQNISRRKKRTSSSVKHIPDYR